MSPTVRGGHWDRNRALAALGVTEDTAWGLGFAPGAFPSGDPAFIYPPHGETAGLCLHPGTAGSRGILGPAVVVHATPENQLWVLAHELAHAVGDVRTSDLGPTAELAVSVASSRVCQELGDDVASRATLWVVHWDAEVSVEQRRWARRVGAWLAAEILNAGWVL